MSERRGEEEGWVGGGGSPDSNNIPAPLYTHEAFLNKYPVFVLESTHRSPNRYVLPLALLMRCTKKKVLKHVSPQKQTLKN